MKLFHRREIFLGFKAIAGKYNYYLKYIKGERSQKPTLWEYTTVNKPQKMEANHENALEIPSAVFVKQC